MSNESVLVLHNFFAILAIICLVAAVGLLVYRLVKGPRPLPFSVAMRSGWPGWWPPWPPSVR